MSWQKPIEQSKMELELESTRTGQLHGLANPALLAQTAATHGMPTEQHLRKKRTWQSLPVHQFDTGTIDVTVI